MGIIHTKIVPRISNIGQSSPIINYTDYPIGNYIIHIFNKRGKRLNGISYTWKSLGRDFGIEEITDGNIHQINLPYGPKRELKEEEQKKARKNAKMDIFPTLVINFKSITVTFHRIK